MEGTIMDKDKQVFCTEEEEEISLVELMVQLLSGWKKILLLALLFAVLLGGYRSVKGLQERSAQSDDIAEAEEKYQTELKTYELQQALLDDQIESTSESIQQNTAYREHSVLMQLDPYNYVGASIVYFIDAHYTLNPNTVVQDTDPTSSLVRAYEAKLQTASFYQYLAEIPALQGKLDSSAFQELVSIQAERDTRMLTINVVAEDQGEADAVVDAVQQYVAEMQNDIAGKIAAHDLQLLSVTSYRMNNGSASNSTDGATLNALGNSVATRQQDMENTLRDLNQKLEDFQSQKNELEEPEKPEGIGTGLKKEAIKFAFIGLVLGAFLGCGWITLDMLFGDRFCDEDELQQRYGLAVLGSLRRFPEKGLVNRACAALSGDRNRQADMSTLAELARSNVAACLRNQQETEATVLFVGSENKKFSALTAALSEMSGAEKYQLCGDILQDPAAVAMLQPGVHVVVCEEKGSAKRQTIINALRKLQSLDCDTLGIVSL